MIASFVKEFDNVSEMLVLYVFRLLNVFATGAQVSDIACSHDGKYLFSVGGQDLTVNMWRINTQYVCFYLAVVRRPV